VATKALDDIGGYFAILLCVESVLALLLEELLLLVANTLVGFVFG